MAKPEYAIREVSLAKRRSVTNEFRYASTHGYC